MQLDDDPPAADGPTLGHPLSGVRHRQHVGMRRRHIKPGGEAREPPAFLLHVGDGLRRHQLGALAAEQIGE